MFGFLKNAFLNGLMILIPVVIVIFALRELFELVILDEFSLALTHFGLGLSETMTTRRSPQ